MADELQGLERRVFNALVREWHQDTPEQIRVELTRSPPYPSLDEIQAALARLRADGWLLEEPPGHWQLSPNGHASRRSLLGATKYSVRIATTTPHETKTALEAAGIPSIGPAMAGFTESPETWTTSNRITAVLSAPDPAAAVAKLRQIVGPSAEMTEPEPYG